MNLNGFSAIPNWIVADPYLTDAQLRMLQVFWSYLNGRRDGYCLDQAQLARDLHRSQTQICVMIHGETRKGVQTLVGLASADPRTGRDAFLRVQVRRDRDGRQLPNRYFLISESFMGVAHDKLQDAHNATAPGSPPPPPRSSVPVSRSLLTQVDNKTTPIPSAAGGEPEQVAAALGYQTPGALVPVMASTRVERAELDQAEPWHRKDCANCGKPLEILSILRLPDGRRRCSIELIGSWSFLTVGSKRTRIFDARGARHFRCDQ